MKASDFDKKFDEGEDVSDFLDLEAVRRLGVARQALIKLWLADRLSQNSGKRLE